MGTSSDYVGGTGGKWTPYKHATSNYARHGGEGRADKVLARYVGAMGGAGAVAAGTRAFGVAAGQALAGLGAGIATDGLTSTLQSLGLGDLVGKNRWEVLDGLLEAFGGDGSSLEDQAVQKALIDAFAELFPEDAQAYEELEKVELDRDSFVKGIERFVANLAYARLLPTLAEKFSHIENPVEARKAYQTLRDRLHALVRLELSDRDPLSVDWRAPEGEAILGKVIDQLYEDMEDLE